MNRATQLEIRNAGHIEYKQWIARTSVCFSPLSVSKEPLIIGRWRSRTVDGFYQGFKRIHITDIARVDPALNARILDSGEGGTILHLPAIMAVDENIVRHRLFQILKSGTGYAGKRNRYLGQLVSGERNWALTDTWLDPFTEASLNSEEFRATVFRPAIRWHLQQFPDEVSRLREAWKRREHLITDAMKHAHGHLRHVEKLIRSGQV